MSNGGAVSLKDQIQEDMKSALRSRQADRLSAIRLLLAAIKQREVDERISLDDAQTVAIVEKLIKQRRDSIEQYDQAGRTDLADRERFELEVLAAYRPAQAGEAEIAAEIEAAIAAVADSAGGGAAGPQTMGRVMGLLKARLAGRADLAQVSARVRTRLSAG